MTGKGLWTLTCCALWVSGVVVVVGGETEHLLTQHKHQSDDTNQDHFASSGNPTSNEPGTRTCPIRSRSVFLSPGVSHSLGFSLSALGSRKTATGMAKRASAPGDGVNWGDCGAHCSVNSAPRTGRRAHGLHAPLGRVSTVYPKKKVGPQTSSNDHFSFLFFSPPSVPSQVLMR